jgi:hypothetical protein
VEEKGFIITLFMAPCVKHLQGDGQLVVARLALGAYRTFSSTEKSWLIDMLAPPLQAPPPPLSPRPSKSPPTQQELVPFGGGTPYKHRGSGGVSAEEGIASKVEQEGEEEGRSGEGSASNLPDAEKCLNWSPPLHGAEQLDPATRAAIAVYCER